MSGLLAYLSPFALYAWFIVYKEEIREIDGFSEEGGYQFTLHGFEESAVEILNAHLAQNNYFFQFELLQFTTGKKASRNEHALFLSYANYELFRTSIEHEVYNLLRSNLH